jgi:hypothetical protein
VDTITVKDMLTSLAVCDICVIGALLSSSQKVFRLSIVFVVTHTWNAVHAGGWLYLEQVMETSHRLPEGTEKPPQGYTTLALQPFSEPTDQAALPQYLHHLTLLTPLPLDFNQPPNAAFLTISQLSCLLHFFLPHAASFCLHQQALPALILHFIHHPLHSSFPP